MVGSGFRVVIGFEVYWLYWLYYCILYTVVYLNLNLTTYCTDIDMRYIVQTL